VRTKQLLEKSKNQGNCKKATWNSKRTILRNKAYFTIISAPSRIQLIEGHRNRFEKELNNQSDAGKNLSKIQDHLNTLVGNEQWEYLIVSYGKTSFVSVSESVADGSSKLTAFKEFSELLYGSEAISTQEKLDILGRLDWELVSVVGAIGGDQQFVLKRPRNVNRAEIELLVASELKETLEAEKKTKDKAAELYAKILEERKQALEEREKASLVDLDTMEKSAAKKAEDERIFGIIRQCLIESGVKQNEVIETQYGEVLVKEISIKKTDYRSGYKFNIEIDGSAALVKEGRKYRSSQCQSIAEMIVTKIKNTFSRKGVSKMKYYSESNLEGSIVIRVSNADASDKAIGGIASIDKV
jgi:hypothetical protein